MNSQTINYQFNIVGNIVNVLEDIKQNVRMMNEALAESTMARKLENEKQSRNDGGTVRREREKRGRRKESGLPHPPREIAIGMFFGVESYLKKDVKKSNQSYNKQNNKCPFKDRKDERKYIEKKVHTVFF